MGLETVPVPGIGLREVQAIPKVLSLAINKRTSTRSRITAETPENAPTKVNNMVLVMQTPNRPQTTMTKDRNMPSGREPATKSEKNAEKTNDVKAKSASTRKNSVASS